MAHGWDSYFPDLPSVSSDPRTLTETLESEHLENFIEHCPVSDTVASNEAPVANSNFNTNHCSKPDIGNSNSDCVFQNYYKETPWQADGEQVEKPYSLSSGNGDIPNFTTDGLAASISFPSSFATDFQGLKQNAGMLATPILEDYSDVSSCSDADDTRPSCKFMASNPVPKFGTKHHSSQWLFSSTGETFPPESLCSLSETNANLPRTSIMKAEEKHVESQGNPGSTSSSIMTDKGSKTVEDQNHCQGYHDQEQEKDVEKDFLQGKQLDILISGSENVTGNGIPQFPEEEEQVVATTSTNISTSDKVKEEYSDLNYTDGHDRFTRLYKQDKSEVLRKERKESDSFKIETFDEDVPLISNSNKVGEEREITSDPSQSNMPVTSLLDSKDCTLELGETMFQVCSSTLKNSHDDEGDTQDSVCIPPTLRNDGHLNDTSVRKEQYFASYVETGLYAHNSSTYLTMHPGSDWTDANKLVSQDPNYSCSIIRASPTIDVDKNVSNPPESCLQMDKSSIDLDPCLEKECTDSTERPCTITTTDLQCSNPVVTPNEQNDSSILESTVKNTNAPASPGQDSSIFESTEKNTNAPFSPGQQQPMDQSPMILPTQSLSGVSDENTNAFSSPGHQQLLNQSPLSSHSQSLSGETDESAYAPTSPDHQKSADESPLAQPQSLSGDTDKSAYAPSSPDKQQSKVECLLAQQPTSLTGKTDKVAYAPSSPDKEQSAEESPSAQQPPSHSGDTDQSAYGPSFPDKEHPADESSLAQQPPSLRGVTDGTEYGPSSPDKQQPAEGCPFAHQPKIFSGDTDRSAYSPDKQQSVDKSPSAQQPYSLSGDTDTRESFKKTDITPLSREESSVTEETAHDTNGCNEISVGLPERNTMDYSEQTSQLTSSIQLKKHLQPVVLLQSLDSVNGTSKLYHCGNCQYKTHSVDGQIEHQSFSHFIHNFQFCKTQNLDLMKSEQKGEQLSSVKETPQLSSDTSLMKTKRCGKHKCDRCNIRFRKLPQYISHMRIHSGKTPYRCSGCGLYFSQTCSLQRHKRIPGRCKMTNQTVTKSDAVTSKTEPPPHNDIVQKQSSANLPECYVKLVDIFKNNTCSFCGKHFSTLNKAKKHYNKVHKENKLEATSNQSTTKASCVTIKVENDKLGSYHCPLCPRVFKYSFNRTRHLRDCVLNLITGGKGKVGKAYGCPLCHNLFTTPSSRAKHVKSLCFRRYINLLSKETAKLRQNAKQEENKPEQETQSKETEQHTKLGAKEQKRPATSALTFPQTFPRYKCNLCPAVFYYSSGKSRHMKKHELFKLTGKMFKYRNSMPKLKTNESVETDESKVNFKLADENSKPPLSCRFCGQNFGSPQSLKKHEHTHRGERPYGCLECKKRFKRHCHLIAHKNVHKKRIQCTICRKILGTIGELIQHKATHGKKEKLQCPDCPLQFQFPVHLRKHLEVHKKKENREPKDIEQASFNPSQPLDSVEQQIASRKMQCSLCKEIFTDAKLFRKHCFTHITRSSSNLCPFCKHKFAHRRYLLRHMIIHTGDKSFSCTNCGKQFYRLLYLNLHREKCLPAQMPKVVTVQPNTKVMGPYKCSYCPRTFSKKDRVIKHHQAHKTKSLLLCSKCGQYYGLTKLNRHQKECGVPSERNTDTSNDNLKQSTSQSNWSGHKKPLKANSTKVLQFKCPHCTQSFRFKSTLLRHLVSHTGVQPYSCVHCGQRYRSRSMCFQHAAFCDGVYKQGPTGSKLPLNKAAQKQAEYKCKFCTKTFTKPRYLRSHILTHNEVKPYRCKACDSCFSRYDHLKVHHIHCNGKRQRLQVCIPKITLNDVGKGWQNKFAFEAAKKQQTFDCEVCPRSFPTQSKLSRHFTMYHSTKRFKCERCGDSFSHEKTLKAHKKKRKCRKVSIETNVPLPLGTDPPTEKAMKPHDVVRNRVLGRIKTCSNKKYKYVCSYCPRAFGDHRSLAMHTRLHTGEKPYACEHCGERFIRKDYLYRHLTKCTKRGQQLKVLCDNCGEFFSKATLENHKIKCPVKTTVMEANDCLSQQSTPQSSPKGFSCAYCSSRFLLFSQLQEHFINAHELETVVPHLSTASLQHHLSNISSIKEEPLEETCDEQLTQSANLTCKLDTAVDNQFVCPDCNMTFSNKAGLVGHMRVHSKEHPFNCKTCKKGFWNKTLLRNHYRKCKLGYYKETHTRKLLESPLKAQIDFALDDSVLLFKQGSTAAGSEVLPTNFSCKDDTEEQNSKVNKVQSKYQCSECDKSFTDGLLLISHLEDHGREELQKKHKTCLKCGIECSSQSSLEKHMKLHGLNQKFPCPDCSKIFYVLSDLEIHKASHKQNRPYTCNICYQRFWTRPSLHNHFREDHPGDTFPCPFCRKSFSIKKSLTRHLKKCHSKEHEVLLGNSQKSCTEKQSSDEDMNYSEDSDSDFPCHVCSKTFPTSESLEDHQRCHLGEKPFECEECGRCFYQASQLQQHQRMHKSEFKCQACGRGFVSLFALHNHKHTHAKNRPHRCSKCDFSFAGPSQLAEHMTTHREENFPCDVCNQVFQSKSSRAEHRKIHSKSNDCPPLSLSRADHESPSSESSLVFTQELKYRCGVCQKRFKDPEDLSEHGCMSAAERSYTCIDCDEHFLHASHLKKHKNIHHSSWLTTEYPCNLCNNSFSSRQFFLSHLKIHINPSTDFLQKTEGINRDPLQDCICPVCHLCFSSANELIGHFPTHIESVYECKICKMTFPTGHKLKEHEHVHLTSTTEFECTECGLRFLGSEAFRQHHCSRQQHDKMESKFSVSPAKASPSPYYKTAAADEEDIDVTGEETYSCRRCTMQFSSKSSLLEHENKWHDKPFECGHCGKRFALRQYLRKHERRHHETVVIQPEEKRFRCIECSAKFDSTQELALHMRLHAETEVGEYRCDMCYKSFSHWTRLKQHQESHVGEVVYECTECDKAFAFPHLLEEHQQSHAGSSQQ